MADRTGLVLFAALMLGACSPIDVTVPRGSNSTAQDTADASRIVLKLASTPSSGSFVELDVVTVTASVLTPGGTEVASGDVAFEVTDGNDIVRQASRSADLRLKSGANVVHATFRNAHAQILQASLTISAVPAIPKELAVVWQSDGTITEIPRPANVRTLYPKAINERGEVVGTAQLATGGRAFIWSAAEGFRFISSALEDYSEGEDINDNGTVAGYRRIVTRYDGFLWSPVNGFVSISPDASVMTAVGINNAGVVAGGRNGAAVIWSAEAGLRQLAVPAGTECSGTLAISGSGYVLGWASTQYADGWCTHSSPLLWSPDGSMHTITDCSAMADCVVQVVDVNSEGEVIGNRNGHPFRWSLEGGFRELLGDASGLAVGSNDRGEVAGAVDYPTPMPIVWRADNSMRVLPIPAGYTLGTAYALNNHGQVVGVVR